MQRDASLLVDVFESFHRKCIEIYELDPAHFLSVPGLVWHSCLNKAGLKLDFLTDIDMPQIVEKRVKSRKCQVIHRIINIRKTTTKTTNHLI